MPRLPEEIWQRIAGHMTVGEWATSGALCCRMFSRMQLHSLDLHFPRAGWSWKEHDAEGDFTSLPGGTMLSSLRWACTHWQAARDLKVVLLSQWREADENAVEAFFTDSNAPNQVKRLSLLASGSYHNDQKLVDPGFSDWMLTSIHSVEVMCINIWGIALPPLSHMTALKHLDLVGYDGEDALEETLSNLPSLESLKIFGKVGIVDIEDRYDKTDGLNLRSLPRLNWLKLSFFLPGSLELRPWCRVALHLDSAALAAEHFEEVWRAVGHQVDTFDCYDQHQNGVNDFSFLQAFPKLEQLTIKADWDNDWVGLIECPVEYVPVNLSLCPRLHNLTHLKVLYVDLKPLKIIQVTIPGHLPLRTLILTAQRLHLRLESANDTASRLEEMIVGSFEPEPQITGADLFELMDNLIGRGFVVGTAVSGGDGFAYSSKKVCFYTRRRGERPKTYEEVTERTTKCICGKCWCCLYGNS